MLRRVVIVVRTYGVPVNWLFSFCGHSLQCDTRHSFELGRFLILLNGCVLVLQLLLPQTYNLDAHFFPCSLLSFRTYCGLPLRCQCIQFPGDVRVLSYVLLLIVAAFVHDFETC